VVPHLYHIERGGGGERRERGADVGGREIRLKLEWKMLVVGGH
jgi:hypothetical protein